MFVMSLQLQKGRHRDSSLILLRRPRQSREPIEACENKSAHNTTISPLERSNCRVLGIVLPSEALVHHLFRVRVHETEAGCGEVLARAVLAVD